MSRGLYDSPTPSRMSRPRSQMSTQYSATFDLTEVRQRVRSAGRSSKASTFATEVTSATKPVARLKKLHHAPTISKASQILNVEMAEAYDHVRPPPPGSPLLAMPTIPLPKEGGESVVLPGMKMKGPRSPQDAEDDLLEQMMKERQKALLAKQAEEELEEKKRQQRLFAVSKDDAPRLKKNFTQTIINKLRSDPAAFSEFSHEQMHHHAEVLRKRKELYSFNAIDRHKGSLAAGAYSPSGHSSALQQRSTSVNQKLAEAKQRRAVIKEERREYFQSQVDRVHRVVAEHEAAKLDIWTPAEVTTAWVNTVCIWLSAYRFDAMLKANAVVKKQQEARHSVFSESIFIIRRIQRWWRDKYWRLVVSSRKKAAATIITTLKGCSRFQVQFAVAMRRLITRVVGIQRHYRAVVKVRKLRLQHGAQLITECSKRDLQLIEQEINHLVKERQLAEVKSRAAIKSRKPYFDGLVKDYTARIQHLRIRRNDLDALQESTKQTMVIDIINRKQEAYNAALTVAAKAMFDKFQALYSQENLHKRKSSQYVKELEHRSITEVRLFTQRDIFLIQSESLTRPIFLLAVSPEEAQEVYDKYGAELAHGDFLEVTDKEFLTPKSEALNPEESSLGLPDFSAITSAAEIRRMRKQATKFSSGANMSMSMSKTFKSPLRKR